MYGSAVSLTLVLEGDGWVVNAMHCCFTAGKETHYPLYRRLSGPQGQYGHVRKISSQLGFDSRTIEPIVNRYTDCAVLAHIV